MLGSTLLNRGRQRRQHGRRVLARTDRKKRYAFRILVEGVIHRGLDFFVQPTFPDVSHHTGNLAQRMRREIRVA